MRKTSDYPSLGLLFTTVATLVSPVHEGVAHRPLYGSIPKLKARSWVSSLVQKAMTVIDLWRQRASERRSLSLLSNRLLDDIGVNRSQASDEQSKPFWRP